MAITVILGALISGLLYRLGGQGDPFPTKLRDWGCPACFIIALWVIKGWSWWYLPVFALSWGAISSYWKGKAVDMKWWNWALHGLGCGLAALPVIFLGISCNMIILRTLFCAIAMTAVSEFSESVWYEEFWRGVIFTSSVVFLW